MAHTKQQTEMHARVHSRREQLGLSVADVERLMGYQGEGKTDGRLANWIREKRRQGRHAAATVALARALRWSVEELFGEMPPDTPPWEWAIGYLRHRVPPDAIDRLRDEAERNPEAHANPEGWGARLLEISAHITTGKPLKSLDDSGTRKKSTRGS